MKTASISEAKNRLSSYVDLVRQGETVVIKAADAFQLAAAEIVLGGGEEAAGAFVCLDRQLVAAARSEGLPVLPDA